MGDIKFYSPVDFDDTSSGVTIEGNLVANAGIGVGTTTVYSNSLNLNNSGTFRIGNAEMLSKSGNDLSVYQDKLRITSGGNVGIGTTSPGHKLDVAGRIHSANSGIDGGQIRLKNTGGGSTWYWSARTTGLNLGELTVADGQMFIENGGDVGIGTTSPETALHIYRDNTSAARMFMIDQDGTGDASMSFRLAGVEEYAVGIDNSDGNKFKISNSSGVGTNDLLTIDTSSKVGIGTASPESKLHITDANPILIFEDTTNPNKNRIRNVDGSFIYDADYNSQMGNSRHRFNIDGSEKLRIDTNGNVGIGTTSPSAKLHVSGGIKLSDNQYLSWDTSNTRIVGQSGYMQIQVAATDVMRLTSSGDVGIGTTSPSQKLHVSGNARITGAIYDSNNSPGTSGQVLSSTASGTDWIDQGDVVAGSADKALSVTLTVKNTEAVALTKGQVVCAAPSASPPSGNLIEVKLADNNGTDSMPAIGVLNEGLDAAGGANDEGEAIMFGKVSGIDTSAFDVGDEVFVSDTAGGLTKTKPTGVKYIQKIGVVIRDDASNGTIEVFGAGRTNDVPTPLYIDHANQRLGIGTTSPAEKLSVTGNIEINVGAASAQGLIFNENGTQTMGIKYQGGQSGNPIDIFRYQDNTTKVRFLENGNVGIGTTNPTQKLTVNGGVNSVWSYSTATTDQPGFVAADNTTYGTSTNILYSKIYGSGITASGFGQTLGDWAIVASSESSNNGLIIGTYSNKPLIIGTNNNARMIVTNGGNVGIGTTSPAYKIHARTSDATWGYRFENNTGVEDVHTFLSHGGGYGIAVDSTSNSSSTYLMKLAGGTGGTGLGSVERFRVTSAGNVGIGTTAPTRLLTLENDTGTVTNNSQLRINNQGDGDAYIYLYAGSDWSLGVDNSDSDKFKIVSSNDVSDVTGALEIDRSNNATFAGDVKADTHFTSSDTNVTLSTNSDGTVFLRPNGKGSTTAQSTFTTSLASIGTNATFAGNVGIGTTSPDSKLEISQQLSAAGTIDYPYTISSRDDGNTVNQVGGEGVGIKFRIAGNASTTPGDSLVGASIAAIRESSSDTDSSTGLGLFVTQNDETLDEAVRIDQNGNVGIGTTNPTTPLHIKNDAPTIRLEDNTSGDNHYFTANNGELRVQSSGYITIRPNNAISTTFLANGNVGIGTTSPSEKLSVNGTFSSNALWTNSSSVSYWGNYSTAYGGLSWDTGYASVFATAGNSLRLGSNGASPDMVINTNGNVGIGNTTPGERLTVSGNIRLNNNGNQLRDYNSNNIISNASNVITIGSGAITSVNVPTGNVGIGTTSPGYKLDVTGDSTSGVVAVRNSANGRDTFRSENAAGTRTFNIGNDANGHGIVLVRGSSGTTNNYIAGNGNSYFNAGNVGIGTTSPSEKLDVAGNIKSNGEFQVFTGTTDIGQISNLLGALNIQGTSTRDVSLGSDTNPQSIFIEGTNGNVGIGTTSPATWKLTVDSTTVYAASFDTTNNTGVAINGNNTTAAQILGYSSTASTYNDLDIRSNSTAGSGIYIDGSESKVGIGTTSPSRTLDVRGDAQILSTSSTGLRIVGGTTSEVYMIFGDADDNSMGGFGYNNNTNELSIDVNNSEAIRIDSSRNVGIGTTSPSRKLSVESSGSSIIADFKYSGAGYSSIDLSNTVSFARLSSVNSDLLLSPAGTEKMRITSAGNVGIGTTSPSTKLEVVGSNAVRIHDGTDNGSIFFRGDRDDVYIKESSYQLLFGAPSGMVFELDTNNNNYGTLNVTNIGSSRFYINGNTGNVGIGTTSPQQKLDVVGYTRTTTLEANGLTGSINLGYGANFKGGLFNDQYLTGDPANSVNDFVTYAPTKYHITVGTTTNKVITVDSSNNVDINGNIHVTGTTRLDSGGGSQPGFLQNQTPVDAIVRPGGAPEIYLSEPDEWLTINIAGTDYVIPAYVP